MISSAVFTRFRAPWYWLQHIIVLGLALLATSTAHAISGNAQVELAGTGRFDELATRLEVHAATKSLLLADRHALCFAYSKLKNYARLLACLDTLDQQAQQGDRSTRLFGLDDVTPAIHIMRAEAFIDLGRYEEATDFAKQALAWYASEQSDDKDIEANALAALTLAAVFGGDNKAAEGYVAQLEKVNVSWPFHNAYANAKAYALARANLALGNYEKTLQALAENKIFTVQVFLDNLLSGAIFRGASNWVWQELPRGYMVAKSLKELGRLEEAKTGYARLLKVKEAEANGEIYWLILYDCGRIAEAENSVQEAIDLYGRAIAVLETQRASINTEANKIGFVGNKQEVYEHMIQLLLKSGQMERAFEYVERSKSRALIDMLAAKTAVPDFARTSPDEGRVLAAYLQAEVDARLQVPVTAGGGERRNGVIRAAALLRRVAPDVASLVSVDRVALDRIQSLLGKDETLVQYYLRNQVGFAFVLTRSTLKTFPLPLSSGNLEADIKKFREAMEKRDPQIVKHSRQLYERLIAPFAVALKTGNLLLVPHGPLHYLSFSALHDGKNFLIDRFGLRTLPSASVLEYIHTHRASDQSHRAPMLVLGNPDLGEEKYDLPSAQAEAETVARKVPQSRLLLRRAAAETAFMEQAGSYALIHVASHGEFNADAPLASALLLAKDERNDGRLTVAELYAIKLNADLVVLSACETGIGKVANGDDVVGLSRGLLFAGASSIVASLWNVDDLATSYLMERFYAQPVHISKREALRTAQLETRKRFTHPFYWAPFYLIGSER